MADIKQANTESRNVARGLDSAYLDRDAVSAAPREIREINQGVLDAIVAVLGQDTVDEVSKTGGEPLLRETLATTTDEKADAILRSLLKPHFRSWAGSAINNIAAHFPAIMRIPGIGRISGAADLSGYEQDEIEEMVRTMSLVIPAYELEVPPLDPALTPILQPALKNGATDINSHDGYFIRKDLEAGHEENIEETVPGATGPNARRIVRRPIDNRPYYQWAVDQLRGGNNAEVEALNTLRDLAQRTESLVRVADNPTGKIANAANYIATVQGVLTTTPLIFGNMRNYVTTLRGVIGGVTRDLIATLPTEQQKNPDSALIDFIPEAKEISGELAKLLAVKPSAPQKVDPMNLRMLAMARRYAVERVGARARPGQPVEVTQQDRKRAFIRVVMEHMTVEDRDLQEATLKRAASIVDVSMWTAKGTLLDQMLDELDARPGFNFVKKAKGVLRPGTSEEQILEAIQKGTLPIAKLGMLIEELREVAISGQHTNVAGKKVDFDQQTNIGPLVLRLQRAERVYRTITELDKGQTNPELPTTEAVLKHFADKADAAKKSSDDALTKAKEAAEQAPTGGNAITTAVKKNIPTIVLHWLLKRFIH